LRGEDEYTDEAHTPGVVARLFEMSTLTKAYMPVVARRKQ